MIRAGKILESDVYAPDGSKVGNVFDIETHPSGAKVSDAWGKALRVSSLLVGRGAGFARLGYLRRQMRGPHGVRFVAARFTGYVVRWEQIARISPDRIDLRCPVDELEQIHPPA